METFPPALQTKIQEWLKWDRCEATRAEIQKLVDAKAQKELEGLLMSRMEFGTAGLRSKMGAGYSRMNELTIVQTAQGLAKYLKSVFSADDLSNRGVVLGFDARYNSSRFAQLSSNVFLNAGIKVYLMRQITPTPYVPFGVLHYKCVAGVMVTASHNPKEDNGYKVYWSNGAQIVPPHDAGIAAAIGESLTPLDSSWVECPGKAPIDPFDELTKHYFESLATILTKQEDLKQSTVKVVYTAMHGVGTESIKKAIETIGFPESNVTFVQEQCTPDPDFPTVAFPNPEEGKSALDLSIKTADAAGASIILANDPDADRLAVAEKTPDGKWRLFTGNEIGALLGWWALQSFKANPKGRQLSKCLMLSSTVSSQILRRMAAKEGFMFEETLTGFKWMASVGAKRMEEDKDVTVLFAFEEAIGFMCGTRVLDKDGVTAFSLFCECASWLAKHPKRTIAEQINDTYAQYGYHECSNSYVISNDTAKTNEMFGKMRTPSYPETIAGQKVSSVRDLTTNYDSTTADHKAVLPSSSSSNMITFKLANDVVMTIRSSGTEPKIKWYSERVTAQPAPAGELDQFIAQAVEQLMQPDHYGFARRQ